MSHLKPGQKIGVMAPSSYVEREDIDKSAARLIAAGYAVFVHPQTFEKQGQSAGDVLQKSLALQGLWQRSDIDAIWFAGGGNQSMELLGALNFKTMQRHKKTIIGFSDTTTLLNALPHHTGCSAYHAPVFKQLHSLSDQDFALCLDTLSGARTTLPFTDEMILHAGETSTVSGKLIGGNLSLFQYMQTLLPPEHTQDAILCLEDCNEELSHIDRIFCFLKQSGVLARSKAIILGQFTALKDSGRPFERSVFESIKIHAQNLEIPILCNMPFGHTPNFHPLPLGQQAHIDLKTKVISYT